MLDEKKSAMLGDRSAQERIAERGELLPCPICGREPDIFAWRNEKKMIKFFMVKCSCGLQTRRFRNKKRAVKEWNTRAPILSAEEMEMLNGKENP